MKETFLVQTEVFQGPLDLLLSLIEKRKLLINEVSLAKITDDYISYIQNSSDTSLKRNSHFILVASTLVLIKSKSILPTLDLSKEEEENIDDLEKRLKIYKRIKDTEKYLIDLFGSNPKYIRLDSSDEEIIYTPPKNISLDLIKESMLGVLNNIPKVEKTPKAIVKKVISLEETITNLTERIKQSINMSFKEFSNYDKTERVNVVVSFLAMLELVKEGIIDASQDNAYEDINMQTKVFETPNYS
jgi:segregation and condensation protein A